MGLFGCFNLNNKGSTNTAWKRDNLRVSISSAPSIEETGLDFSLYGEGLPFFTPHESPLALQKASGPTSDGMMRSRSLPAPRGEPVKPESFVHAPDGLQSNHDDEQESTKDRKFHLLQQFSCSKSPGHGQTRLVDQKVKIKSGRGFLNGNGVLSGKVRPLIPGKGKKNVGKENGQETNMAKEVSFASDSEEIIGYDRPTEVSAILFGELGIDQSSVSRIREEVVSVDISGSVGNRPSTETSISIGAEQESQIVSKTGDCISIATGKSTIPDDSTLELESISSLPARPEIDDPSIARTVGTPASSATVAMSERKVRKPIESVGNQLPPKPRPRSRAPGSDSADIGVVLQSSVVARNRWRRLKHTVAFANHMAQNVKTTPNGFLEHEVDGQMYNRDSNSNGDAGRVGAAAFEGARTGTRFRAKGRRGMDGLLVRQDKGMLYLFQDFYVACLKMPISHFLVGVFVAPLALGLLFTPVYLFDMEGLTFEGVTLTEANRSRMEAAKQQCTTLVNVFLYALSLSTTFGGSPVAALSPFCLLVANLNTLMAQFLFVFLSGAVFARMSQPSHPIRCSRKAIIRSDDFVSTPVGEGEEKFKVFSVRLVLTGPPPCELVDAKICLTFRIFIKLPSGSMFCSTQDLDLVRPEVSYLRYGIMVRHIVDKKSPVYGHTMESLLEGDASFSLTIMGLERTSMQPIFHLEDYFVCDGDIAWDADYVDFIHVNHVGQRVLDHSKIDLLKVPKEENQLDSFPSFKKAEAVEKDKVETVKTQPVTTGWIPSGSVRGRKLWNSKSASFTRADW